MKPSINRTQSCARFERRGINNTNFFLHLFRFSISICGTPVRKRIVDGENVRRIRVRRKAFYNTVSGAVYTENRDCFSYYFCCRKHTFQNDNRSKVIRASDAVFFVIFLKFFFFFYERQIVYYLYPSVIECG